MGMMICMHDHTCSRGKDAQHDYSWLLKPQPVCDSDQQRPADQGLRIASGARHLLQQQLQVGERAQVVQRVAQAFQVARRQLSRRGHRVQARRQRCMVRAAGRTCACKFKRHQHPHVATLHLRVEKHIRPCRVSQPPLPRTSPASPAARCTLPAGPARERPWHEHQRL